MEEKRSDNSNDEKMQRYRALTGDDAACIEELRTQVKAAKALANQALIDIALANAICSRLTDIMIADVDFSPAVREAAKKKMIGTMSLYDKVKKEFDIVRDETGMGEVTKATKIVRKAVPASQSNPSGYVEVEQKSWATVEGVGRDAPLQQRQSAAFIDHDKVLSAAKLRANGPEGIPKAFLAPITQNVLDSRYAVCESITATVVERCKAIPKFGGPIEWVGVWYSKKSGHSIVIVDRAGDLRNPKTWGQNWFIVDMWFYNLGMRNQYLWSTDEDRERYLDAEIVPHLGKNGGPTIMARLV
jgi:hypothetical protein